MPGTYRQLVPRPARTLAGDPPGWAALAPERRAGVSMGRVRAAIANAGAPGEPRQPEGTAPGGATVGAAVLVALFEEGGEVRTLLIRRAATLDRDPGHVALPGGHVEPGEPPLAAALRESEEEIGLDPAAVEVLGLLPDVSRRRSRHRVLPFVAALGRRPELRPSPAEVEAVLEVSLAELLAEGVAWEERWEGADEPAVRFFAPPALGDDLIWGLTGRILWSLLELVAAAPG